MGFLSLPIPPDITIDAARKAMLWCLSDVDDTIQPLAKGVRYE